MFGAIREVCGWPDLFLGLAVVLAGLAGAMLLRAREVRPPTPEGRLVSEAVAADLGRPAAIHDNFFAIGGHSLLAVRLAAHLMAG